MLDPKAIISGLTEQFQKDPRVVAFVLVGSQARDDIYKAVVHSDMEAFVIVKDEKASEVEQSLPGLIKKFGRVIFSYKHPIGFVAVYDDLFRLELPVIKESEMGSLFSRPKAQTVKVLTDKTGGELEKTLDSRPEGMDYAAFFQYRVLDFWYMQILGAQYFKKGEIYNARSVLRTNSSTLVKLFELLNDPGLLLLEVNKRVEKFLNKEQLMQLERVSPAYDSEQIEVALIEIMDFFSEAANKVKEKYGYDYDKKVEDEIKPKIEALLEK